ncbi:imidazole glycerol phosphate synthase subunit HisH [Sphingomicrobium arenosum]|uniref:imidazole glycerol phosphate synthase subunit HisH n=1 Tax=Sphingomicrobium arenosum TaxID=2233861 RepID=UPI002240EE9D|nr:imidazole glycerol phosphate synthase subunit HisH [Sphingomicrobium arenosum]
MTDLALIDLGYGNVESVRLGFERIGAPPLRTRDPDVIAKAERVILPGVGHAGYAMQRVEQAGLAEVLRGRSGPTLGICVGMQLLFEGSDETDTPLLGILPGKVTSLSPAPGRPVPHMGWTRLHDVAAGLGVEDGDHLYFAHSFACPPSEADAASATYGRTFPVIVRRGPYWGAQFHPERSSAPGAAFLKAFLTS